MRRNEDFDKYEALSLAERLLAIARSSHHKKSTYFSIAVDTLRDKLHCSQEQFKCYFLSLLAEKDYSGILDAVSKVDKLFEKKQQHSDTTSAPSRPPSRVQCWHGGLLGHRTNQCFRKNGGFQPYRPPQPLLPPWHLPPAAAPAQPKNM